MPSLVKIQPFKTVYLVFEGLTTILIRLPIWVVLALPKSNRPRRTWTFKRTILHRFLRYLYSPSVVPWTLGLTKEPDYRKLEQGPKIKGVWMPAVPELITGEVKQWAAISNVESIQIPGYWLEAAGTDLPVGAPPQLGEKVLINFHGGAFACQSAHPDDLLASVPRGVLQAAGPHLVRALTVEFRTSKPRSVSPSNPFPAALLDAICGFNYLVNVVGFAPENIIVAGDSAGGNLAIALARYMIENQGTEGLPKPPGALLLSSPWVDFGPNPTDPSSSIYTNAKSDFISASGPGPASVIDNYVGPHGQAGAVTNRYISPASLASTMPHISFGGFPRTFILNAGAEVLRDQIRVLRDKMKADLGEKVEYAEFPDAWHDFVALTNFEPERSEALTLIGKWIN
ncbi:alpha/beta-hydrolase [Irpex rosettiformis]|uniref:Alpha/beta-hydrolase n=1 Tax=Irpex rosettiformis TaxID=378272 RepID=A0ACB8UFU5_9APHY|nr:alpha/beta-hydrolase [Irpex rosettiformis]